MLLRETNTSDDVIDWFSLRLLSGQSTGASKNTRKTTGLKMRDSEWEDKRENSRALNVFYVRRDGKKERYFMITWAGSGPWIHGWLHGAPSVLRTMDQAESFRSEDLPWQLGIQTFSNWMAHLIYISIDESPQALLFSVSFYLLTFTSSIISKSLPEVFSDWRHKAHQSTSQKLFRDLFSV